MKRSLWPVAMRRQDPQFIVDTTGHVETSNFEVLRST